MVRVALTGGIATGKTHVLDRFRMLGAACFEADQLAHGAMAAGTESARAIKARFGSQVLDASGAVDRKKLGPLVFGDDAARRDLESIVHPVVWRAIEAALRGLASTGTEVAVVEIPLLYEAGRAADFDRVVVTTCPRAMQIERLMRRGLSREEAESRLDAQWPVEEKARRADHVIDTSGSVADTDRQVDEVWKRLQ